MSRRSLYTGALAAALSCSIAVAATGDQELVEEYLKSRGAGGAVIRPIIDDYVGQAFPNFSFFGVIFRQYPVAMQCPQTQDLKCSNVFFVRDGHVGFASNIPDLEFLFATELRPVPTKDAASGAASAWLRLSEELKQDLFYTFSVPESFYIPRADITSVRGQVRVTAGGQGDIEMVMTLGAAGGLVRIYEKSALRPGVRPICQATKLLDRDPIVRRMAEQDLLVMGLAARPYLDQVRATARPALQQAIDRIWQRILEDGR